MGRRLGWLGGLTVAALVIVVAPPAGAAAGGYAQTNLVSDQPGVAQKTDPNLVNAWGMSHGPNTPIWVSDNGTDVSTLYSGDVNGSPVAVVPLVVSIPGGAPTGQVYNDTTASPCRAPRRFRGSSSSVRTATCRPGPAAPRPPWSRTRTARSTRASRSRTARPGRCCWRRTSAPTGSTCSTARSRRCPPTGLFSDPTLPAGYAPFNVAEIGGQVFVTYALKGGEDDIAGPAHGFVDVYTTSGALVKRFATHGVLNSPWGMTIAPANFGAVLR